MAARSAILPVCIWTRLNATSVVAARSTRPGPRTAPRGRSAPRSLATSSGNRLEVNSSAGTTTSSPGPSIPATSPVPTDAAGMVAIVSSGGPDERGEVRAAPVGRGVPVRHPVAGPGLPHARRPVQRIDRRLRRQPVRRAVEIRDPGRRDGTGPGSPRDRPRVAAWPPDSRPRHLPAAEVDAMRLEVGERLERLDAEVLAEAATSCGPRTAR